MSGQIYTIDVREDDTHKIFWLIRKNGQGLPVAKYERGRIIDPFKLEIETVPHVNKKTVLVKVKDFNLRLRNLEPDNQDHFSATRLSSMILYYFEGRSDKVSLDEIQNYWARESFLPGCVFLTQDCQSIWLSNWDMKYLKEIK